MSVLRLCLLALSVSLIACGGGDEPTPAPAKTAGKAADGTRVAGQPNPYVPVVAAPLQATEELDLGAEVVLRGGDEVVLSSLLQGPTVLYYTSDDRRGGNLGASRLLRDVMKGADAVGARVIVLFDEGTSPKKFDTWFKKRRVPLAPATIAHDESGDFAEANDWDLRTVALLTPEGGVAKLWRPSEDLYQRLGTDGFSADLFFAAWAPVDPGPTLDAATKQAAVELVRAVLATEWEDGAEIPDALIDPAKAAGLGADVKHGAWVELFLWGELQHPRARVTEGTLGEAIAQAAQAAIAGAAEPATWRERKDDVMISVHVEGEATPLPTRELTPLWYMVEPGVDGLIHRFEDSEGIMLGSEPITDGLLTPRVRSRKKKLPKMLGTVSRRAGHAVTAWKDPAKGELLRFRTTSFGTAVPAGPVEDMFRGNVLRPERMDEAAILDTIKEGGRWLLNTVGDDGKFDYEYFPNRDEHGKGYNIVRHAGSVYGLFEMYHLAMEEPTLADDRVRYIDAAARALGYVHEGLGVPKGAPEDRVCLIYKDSCESGTAALTLLTFLARPDVDTVPENLRDEVFRPGDDAKMEGLGLVLLDMIDGRGAIFRRYRESLAADRVGKEPLYYPGEAMLALMRFYEKTGDERWLEGARAIGERQQKLYLKKRMWPDHWVMQALPRLWLVEKDDDMAEACLAMAMHSIGEQYPFVWNPFPDYQGAWRRRDDTPRTTRAGSRAEAIRGVMHLAWERGDDASMLEESLIELSRHLAEQQYGERNSWWTPVPEKVRGAYPMGIVDNHVRIDNNQHALVGIAGALEAVRKRAGKAPAEH